MKEIRSIHGGKDVDVSPAALRSCQIFMEADG